VTTVYTDNDISASNGKPRPAYRRMLDDLREGLAGAVVVWDLDRLHRRPKELEEFIELADEHHIALASVGGDVDLSTPQGRMVARIKGAVARQEADQISRRVRRKFDQLAATGHVSNGGRRPFGYTRDRMALVPEEAATVRELAARVLTGESLRELVGDLQARNVPTSTGAPWSRQAVRTLLCSARIAGLRRHRDQVVGPAAWPAILDRATWEAVRAVLTDPDRRALGHANTRRFLLSGIARCSMCGGPLHVHHRTPSDHRTNSYACRRRGCGKVAVRVPALDEFVTRLVVARLEREGVQPLAEGHDDQLGEELVAVEARLQQVAVEFADDPEVTPEQLRTITRRLRERLEELKGRQADRVRSDVLAGLDGANVAEVWPTLSLARRRAIVGVTIGPFTVAPASRRGSPRFEPERVDVPAWRRTESS
jgi:DNA invertase Pin-like site-specific DNA recombinase